MTIQGMDHILKGIGSKSHLHNYGDFLFLKISFLLSVCYSIPFLNHRDISLLIYEQEMELFIYLNTYYFLNCFMKNVYFHTSRICFCYIYHKTYCWISLSRMKQNKNFFGCGNILDDLFVFTWKIFYLLYLIHEPKQFHIQVHQSIFQFSTEVFLILHA